MITVFPAVFPQWLSANRCSFFGARANLAKSLLLAINGGIDEKKGTHVIPNIVKDDDEVLEYSKVLTNYKKVLSYVAELYVDTINIIHFMHDKYAYESSQMALHDTLVERIAAFGVAGLSIAADSLSAIKFGKVRPVRNEEGIAVDFEVEGDFPKYGNDNDLVDDIAVEIVAYFSAELKKHPLYRNGIHTLSALTITSNVMYGKKPGQLRTDAKPENLLPRVRTQCTEEIPTGRWHL